MEKRRRQSPGRGTIRKRAARPGHPSRWEARFTYYKDDRRRQGSVYGTTQREVASKLDEELRKLGLGYAPIYDRRQTLAEYLAVWLEGRQLSLRPRTWDTYASIIGEHLSPELGRVRLVQLTPQAVNRYLRMKRESGLSSRTVAHHRAVLRTALNDAIRHSLLERNAAALADAPRITPFEVPPMDPREAHAILRVMAGTSFEAPVGVSFWTGLRIGETLGLRWGDIDFDIGEIHVRQALSRRHGETRFVEPKSRSSRRTVRVPEPLAETLNRHLRRQIVRRREIGLGVPSDDDLVFTSPIGEPVEPTGLSHQFTIALIRAGLRPRRWHDLRHGYGTLSLAARVDLKTVSRNMGHSTITLTANTYAGVVDALTRDAADRLTALMADANDRSDQAGSIDGSLDPSSMPSRT